MQESDSGEPGSLKKLLMVATKSILNIHSFLLCYQDPLPNLGWAQSEAEETGIVCHDVGFDKAQPSLCL